MARKSKESLIEEILRKQSTPTRETRGGRGCDVEWIFPDWPDTGYVDNYCNSDCNKFQPIPQYADDRIFDWDGGACCPGNSCYDPCHPDNIFSPDGTTCDCGDCMLFPESYNPPADDHGVCCCNGVSVAECVDCTGTDCPDQPGVGLCDEDIEVELWGECYNIQNTTVIDKSGFNLCEIGPCYIPTEIGNLVNLTDLNLSDNNLGGMIPQEIGNLTSLNQLFLYDNQLEGDIPIQLWNLIGLDVLYLHNNNLTGELPSQIGNMTNLIQFYLANNQLSGVIPNEVCNIVQSTYFWVSDNSFCPPYPDCGDGPITSEEYQDTSNCDDTDECILGDVNGDGFINIMDIVMVVDLLLINAPYDFCADVNGDGSMDVLDVVMMVNIVLNDIESSQEKQLLTNILSDLKSIQHKNRNEQRNVLSNIKNKLEKVNTKSSKFREDDYCPDPDSCNYDPNAVPCAGTFTGADQFCSELDNQLDCDGYEVCVWYGHCQYEVYHCADLNGNNQCDNETQRLFCIGSAPTGWIPVPEGGGVDEYGCNIPAACNFISYDVVDDGCGNESGTCCIYCQDTECYSQTSNYTSIYCFCPGDECPEGFDQNPDIGCMDINACNYDNNAEVDDGSCFYTDELSCLNDWYIQSGSGSTQLLSIPFWINGVDSNVTYTEILTTLCENDPNFSHLILPGMTFACVDGILYGGQMDERMNPTDAFWYVQHNHAPVNLGPFDGEYTWNENTIIPLEEGANLISFPVLTPNSDGDDSVYLGDALPNTDEHILGIIGTAQGSFWWPGTPSESTPAEFGVGGGDINNMCDGMEDNQWIVDDCLLGCSGEAAAGVNNECGCEYQCLQTIYGDCEFEMSQNTMAGTNQTFFFIDWKSLKIYPEWAGEESPGYCVAPTCKDTAVTQNINTENEFFGQYCGSNCVTPSSQTNGTGTYLCKHNDGTALQSGPVRLLLKRDSDQRLYEIRRNPSCADYNEPFIVGGAAIEFKEVCGPPIAVPAGSLPTVGEPGHWIGSLQNLKFGRGYWVLTHTDLPNFNWMGFGNDPRGAVADFEKVNFNLHENWYENNTPIEILNKLKNQLGMETQFTLTDRNDDWICDCSCWEELIQYGLADMTTPTLMTNGSWNCCNSGGWPCHGSCCNSGPGSGTGRIDKSQRGRYRPTPEGGMQKYRKGGNTTNKRTQKNPKGK